MENHTGQVTPEALLAYNQAFAETLRMENKVFMDQLQTILHEAVHAMEKLVSMSAEIPEQQQLIMTALARQLLTDIEQDAGRLLQQLQEPMRDEPDAALVEQAGALQTLLHEVARDSAESYEQAVSAQHRAMPLAQSSAARMMASIMKTVQSILLAPRQKNNP